MYDVEMKISDLHHEAKNGNVGKVETYGFQGSKGMAQGYQLTI